MRTTTEVTIKKTVLQCDRCSTKMEYARNCDGCRCDVCHPCSRYEDNPWRPGTDRMIVCHVCLAKLPMYRNEANVLLEKLADLRSEWKRECKAKGVESDV